MHLSTKENDKIALTKIIEVMEILLRYKYIDFDNLSKIDQLEKQYAIERAFEIIGEATKRLSEIFIQQYSHIQWNKMARLRDRISHHYDDLDINFLLKFIKCNLETDLNSLKLIYKDLICL